MEVPIHDNVSYHFNASNRSQYSRSFPLLMLSFWLKRQFNLKRGLRYLEFSENYLPHLNLLRQHQFKNRFLGFFPRITMFLKMLWCMFGGFPFHFLKTVNASSPLERESIDGCMHICVQKSQSKFLFKKRLDFSTLYTWYYTLRHLWSLHLFWRLQAF